MCDPMTAIGIGLSAAGQAAGFVGASQDARNQNAAAQQNAINASVAATRKYQDEGMRRSYDAKATNQEAYDAVIRAREAKGTAVASAGTSGMDIRSMTVNSILSQIGNAEANTVYNTQAKHDDADYAFRSSSAGIEAEAQGRISSMPTRAAPSPLGPLLGIATDGFNIASKSPKFKNWLGAGE